MNKNNYKYLNNLFGWVCFLIATAVYVLTMERTGSWWDCGEFISCDYKLQVPHQPGAPLYIMIYKIFTLLAGGDRTKVAFFGNFASAACSGATILFLFWTITAFAKKLIARKDEALTQVDLLLIFASGFVGALAYTFSDTFWFSAVEAEVYAMASLTVAVTFWAALKWEAVADEPFADRWLVLIAFLTGLSVGVHLLNLLTIPAVVFIVYFRRFVPSRRGMAITLLVSIVILGLVQLAVIPGTIQLMASTDRLFVNSIGLPMGSGVIFFGILLVAFIAAGVYYAYTRNLKPWYTGFLCLAFLYIGYGCFIQAVVRAHADTPLNNQHPDDPYSFLEYLTRSQYGDGAPLLTGPIFTSTQTGTKPEGDLFKWDGKIYEKIGTKFKEEYDVTVPFPRIWDTDNRLGHVDFYRNWLGLAKDAKPTYIDNLKFFLGYQIFWMYGRYFFWNFSGRQNDIQGTGDRNYGNCITGIAPLDAIFLGKQVAQPASALVNKAHNTLFLLPFILGVIGLTYLYKRRRFDAVSIIVFFLFTGLAIIVYLNQTGVEPRERDYSFGGSFYAFCIWIGLGVIGVADWLRRITKPLPAAGIAAIVCLFAVPILMASQEWDDHDRSQRTVVRDFASNYLNSCAPNAILFTYGDNDTYPLWYVQEVEGVRPDVRIVNLSLLGIDWYIKQMHEPMNSSAPLPFTLSSMDYFGNNRNIVPYYDSKIAGDQELKDIMEVIGSNDQSTKIQYGDTYYNYLPTRKVKITVNPAEVIKTGTVPPDMKDSIVHEMKWTIPGNNLYKNDVAELDMIATNQWKRPIYFSRTLPPSSFLGLKAYCQLEGLAYRLMPVKAKKYTDEYAQIAEPVNLNVMYDNFMNKFKWGNMVHTDFLDLETRLTDLMVMKQTGWNLAYNLYKENKLDSAKKVLDRMTSETPQKLSELNDRNVSMIQINELIAALYYKLKLSEQGHRILDYTADYTNDYLNYFKARGTDDQKDLSQNCLYMLQQMAHDADTQGDKALNKKISGLFRTQAIASGFNPSQLPQ